MAVTPRLCIVISAGCINDERTQTGLLPTVHLRLFVIAVRLVILPPLPIPSTQRRRATPRSLARHEREGDIVSSFSFMGGLVGVRCPAWLRMVMALLPARLMKPSAAVAAGGVEAVGAASGRDRAHGRIPR